MNISDAGRALIKRFEGLRLDAYRCPAGVWTIGYGHTGDSVRAGRHISEHQADEILAYDLERFEESVSKLCPGATQGQFDAMVSFAFNLGTTALANSTLRKYFQHARRAEKLGAEDKAAEYDELAAGQFKRWIQSQGKILTGLVIRRAAEAELYLS